MLVDVCVVVPVIELDVDACDDNFVDWGGAPGVTVVVLVAYKRNHFYVSLNFDIKFLISKLL